MCNRAPIMEFQYGILHTPKKIYRHSFECNTENSAELIEFKFTDPVMTMGAGEPNVGLFIEEHKKRADADPNAPPFDDLRNYAYEGGGSTAGSLSSLQSGNHIILISGATSLSG